MIFLTASKLLLLPFLASLNAVQAVEKAASSKVNSFSSTVQNKKGSLFGDNHRALHQQKLNDLKTVVMEKARSLELSEETQQLLDCFEESVDPVPERITVSFKKKDYAQVTYNQPSCGEGYKESAEDYVVCNYETPYQLHSNFCIPDADTCPDDVETLLRAIVVALELENEEGDYYETYYYDLAREKCLYPQCFSKASDEFTVSFDILSEDEPPSPYTCPEIGGTCEVDCEDDDDFICVPGLCYANKDYDSDYEYYPAYFDARDTAVDTADVAQLRTFKTGFGKRQLKKGTKAPKGSKAPKVGKAGKCTCKVPRAGQYS